MALELTTPESVSATITKYEINSFAVDLDRQEIVVGYDRLDASGVNHGESVLTIDGQEFASAIGEASSIAGADVYSALKQALYSQIISRTGNAGTVS